MKKQEVIVHLEQLGNQDQSLKAKLILEKNVLR